MKAILDILDIAVEAGETALDEDEDVAADVGEDVEVAEGEDGDVDEVVAADGDVDVDEVVAADADAVLGGVVAMATEVMGKVLEAVEEINASIQSEMRCVVDMLLPRKE